MLKSRKLLQITLATFLVTAGFENISADPIRINSGVISGVQLEDSPVRVYRGIPFAAPPVDGLRWKPPQPPTRWDGVRACDEFGPSALQPASRFFRQQAADEDCLYLNVWTPAQQRDEQLPVMIWIHGGGFTSGSGRRPSYNGRHLAERNVIVVTINYRLGALGFFAHPLLSTESPRGISGNYGLLDQIAALKWVRENISAFGGNPERVTIFGESAGGSSVYLLIASPLAKGLFQGAILQSPWLDTGVIADLRADSFAGPSVESLGKESVEQVVAGSEDPLAALRAIPAKEILTTLKRRYPVAVDGWLLPDFPHKIFSQQRQNNVPSIVGTNTDEGTMFVGLKPFQSVDEYTQAQAKKFGEFAPRILHLYPVEQPSSIRRAVIQQVTDGWFVRPSREYARAMSQNGGRAWMYHFTRVSRSWPALGAAHAAEIGYVFNSIDQSKMREVDRQLSDAMMSYWVEFAKTGEPNHDGQPDWPEFSLTGDHHLVLGPEIKVGSGLCRDACDLLDEYLIHKRKR